MKPFWGRVIVSPERSFFEIGIAILLGALFGALIILSPYVPISRDFQKLILVIPFVFTIVILFNNIERLLLLIIAVGVPLNLDISIVISPYARNIANVSNGRTIVALTELRISLIMLVVLVGYLFWLVGQRGPTRFPLRYFAGTTLPALGLILVSTLTMLQAPDKQLALFKVLVLVELFLIYFYIANHIHNRNDFIFIISAFMGALLLESILMIVQWRTGFSFSLAGISASIDPTTHRAAGTLGTANTAGVILTAYLIMSATMFWIFPKKFQKVFAGICFVFGSVALISTAGRAAWLGFLVAILVFLIFGWQRRLVARRILVLLFLSILVIAGLFFPTIYSRFTADDRGSAASRMIMNRLAWNVIKSSTAHFYFGIGANNYALLAPAYYTSDIGDLGYIIDSSVHNTYLLVWAETGIIGLAIFLCFLAVPLMKIWKYIQSNDRFVSLMALGLGCGLIAIYIQMLADPFIARPKLIIVWLLIGMACSLEYLIPGKIYHRGKEINHR